MGTQQKEQSVLKWKYQVAGMDFLGMPKGYRNRKESDNCKRFLSFVEQFSKKLLSGSNTGLDFMDSQADSFKNLNYDAESLPNNWWDVAVKVGSGKNINSSIPQIADANEENKSIVYEAFMPAYRALKESFSIFNWLFDHERYVAERDAIKGLAGLMRSLTGDSKDDFEKAYKTYKKEVAIESDTNKYIKKLAAKERKKFEKEEKEYEKSLKNMSEFEKLQEDLNASLDNEELDEDYLYEEDDYERESISIVDESKMTNEKLSEKVADKRELTKSISSIK